MRIKNCVLMHHEFRDGSGYPLHLKGDKIDTVVSIVTVSNIYDEMTSRRTYRAPICPFSVISQFEEEGITKFEPNVIMTFLGNIANTFIANRVMLNTGQTGEIIFVNADHLSRPVVRCGENYVDLSSDKNLSIVAVIYLFGSVLPGIFDSLSSSIAAEDMPSITMFLKNFSDFIVSYRKFILVF